MWWKGRFAAVRWVTLAAVALVLGVLAALAASASQTAAPAGSVANCTAFAYQAIRSHTLLTRRPVACEGLSLAQVNEAAGAAMRMAEGTGTKAERRRQAGFAAPWVSGLFTWPAPAVPSQDTGVSGPAAAGGSGAAALGGVSEFAVRVAALLAWLAAAASGGYVLTRWLRAGGRLRGRDAASDSAGAPSAVIAGHVAFALSGLLLWAGFMLTGAAALAWTATGLLVPVAGAGMGMLVLGLPSPVRRRIPSPAVPAGGARGGTATLIAPAPAGEPAARSRVPVFVIAAHGLFAAVVLLLVITATIGAG
jgi:hypothetical protein